jgi:hypothetical protein
MVGSIESISVVRIIGSVLFDSTPDIACVQQLTMLCKSKTISYARTDSQHCEPSVVASRSSDNRVLLVVQILSGNVRNEHLLDCGGGL